MANKDYKAIRDEIANNRRFVCRPSPEEAEALGPLKDLPGTWKSEGKGWNLIALPFQDGQPQYRLLMNQYSEFLRFKFVDKGVANRGVKDGFTSPTGFGTAPQPSRPDQDQFIAAIDYEQTIKQISQKDAFALQDEQGNVTIDENDATLIGSAGTGIHHEPGMWLHIIDDQTNGNNIARLASIPHGNSVLAIGRGDDEVSPITAGDAIVPDLNALPIGFNLNIPDPLPDPIDFGQFRYLAPYAFFEIFKFFGVVPQGGDFPGFFASNATAILQFDNASSNIVNVRKLDVSTDVQAGGILNIPFIERQADATKMRSTFWIQELGDGTLRLQYIQNVQLDFFRNFGDLGLIKWPHVSINTLIKVSDDPDFEREAECDDS